MRVHVQIFDYFNSRTYADIFDNRRTDESRGTRVKQGVSSPSQKRYVSYIERVLRDGVDYISPKPVILNKVRTMGKQ